MHTKVGAPAPGPGSCARSQTRALPGTRCLPPEPTLYFVSMFAERLRAGLPPRPKKTQVTTLMSQLVSFCYKCWSALIIMCVCETEALWWKSVEPRLTQAGVSVDNAFDASAAAAATPA